MSEDLYCDIMTLVFEDRHHGILMTEFEDLHYGIMMTKISFCGTMMRVLEDL